MNTRLQVEHPITELVFGIDIVKEQINVAFGNKVSFKQNKVVKNGHSIECRINAENSKPSSPHREILKHIMFRVMRGKLIQHYILSLNISSLYDGLIAKLIIHGADRQECLMRLRRALLEFVIEGVDTTIPLFQEIIQNKSFLTGKYDINWLETNLV